MKATAKKANLHGDGLRGTSGSNVLEFPRSSDVDRGNEELVEKFQQTKDPRILEKIVARNQGLLHAALKRFTYFPDPYEDLLQVANLALIKAVQRYDKTRGAAFSSYVMAIVDGEIRHHLRDSVLMRQPRWLRKTEKRIEEVSIEFTRKNKRSPTLTELAEAANLSEEAVLEIMRVYASVSLHNVDDPITRERSQTGPDSSVVRSKHYESFSLPIEEKIALAQRFAREMVPRFESGDLKAVVDSRYPFEDVALAHARMEANANVGKILLDVG